MRDARDGREHGEKEGGASGDRSRVRLTAAQLLRRLDRPLYTRRGDLPHGVPVSGLHTSGVLAHVVFAHVDAQPRRPATREFEEVVEVRQPERFEIGDESTERVFVVRTALDTLAEGSVP